MRELAVGLEPQAVAVDVLGRDERVDGQLDADLAELLLDLHLLAVGDRPVGLHRLADKTDVEVKADAGDVPGLLGAQHVAGAAEFEVLHGHGHAGAEVVVLRDGREPVVGGLGQRLLGVVQEVGIAALAGPADAPAELVHLRQSELVGAVDDQRVGVGDVQPGLDDGGTHQHVVLAVPEPADGLLELLLPHLPVRHHDARLGHEVADAGGGGIDGPDAIVYVEHLALAQQLAPDRGRDVLVRVRAHVRQDGQAFLGRGEDLAHLADPGQRHLERARDRRGGHGQHVDVGAQGGDVLLVLHAEALLLVHDHQAEVLPPHTRGEQAVGADHHVDRAVGQPGEDLLGIRVRGEATEPPYGHGEPGHALLKRGEVLLREQGGGHEHRDLGAVLHGLERGAHGHLGLAVAHIAHHHAVHGRGLLHIVLDLLDRAELIDGLGERECVLHLPLPRGVRPERAPGRGLPLGVELDKLGGDLADGLAGLALGVLPVRATHLGQRRSLAADVPAELAERFHGHVQPVPGGASFAGRVLDHQVFAPRGAVAAAHLPLDHLHESPDAVLIVHHQVPGLERERVDLVAALGVPRLGARRGTESVTREVGFGDDDEVAIRPIPAGIEDEPGVEDRLVDGDPTVSGCRAGRRGDSRDLRLGQALLDAVDGAVAGHHYRGPPTCGNERAQPGEHGLHLGVLAARGGRVAGRNGDRQTILGLGEEAAGHELPPRHPGLGGLLADRGERAVPGAGEVERLAVDGGIAAHGGRGPRGLEEFATGRGQVAGAAADLVRIAHHHAGAGGHEHRQRGHLAGHEHRGQRLHAVARDALGERFEKLHQRRVRIVLEGQFASPLAHRVVEQQFAARVQRRGLELALGQGALVGHRELADLGDRVAVELDAQRVVGGRREHVHDAAAHGHVAAAGHHVLAHVGELGQLHQQVGRVELRPLGQPHRLPARRPRGDGLHHRSRRRHHDPRSMSGHHGTEHLQPATDRVGGGRETFMRQRLPGGELRDVVVVYSRQFVGQLLTFPLGRGDHQQRCLSRQGRDQERPQCLRRAHHRGVPVQPLAQVGERGACKDRAGQAGQGGRPVRRGGPLGRGGGGPGRPGIGRTGGGALVGGSGGHACSASG